MLHRIPGIIKKLGTAAGLNFGTSPGNVVQLQDDGAGNAQLPRVDGSLLTGIAASGGLTGFRNRIINGGFSVNQRAVSGTVTLAAGAYGHDRWKAGASGCTYTFSITNNVTTITISAGSLQQVIDGVNLYGGTHVLSWVGTSQGRINGGTYSTSGVTGTATGDTNLTVEFNVGTLSNVQFEPGSTATAFEQRPLGIETSLCLRYYWRFGNAGVMSLFPLAGVKIGTVCDFLFFANVIMRTAPTLSSSTPSYSAASPVGNQVALYDNNLGSYMTITGTLSVTIGAASLAPSALSLRLQASSSFSGSTGDNVNVYFGPSAWVEYSAEL